MVTFFLETTLKGDSFGFSVDSKGFTTNKASRTFTIGVDSDLSRSIPEIYGLLPKKGDSHPYIVACFVKDINVDVTSDVHVYEAKVQYESPAIVETGSGGSEEGIEFPWLENAVILFSSDTSQSEAQETAYAKWDIEELSMDEGDKDPSSIYTYSKIPILNEPFKEKFTSVPEEPISCLALDISFAIKGYTGDRKVHDRGIMLNLLAEYFTVNQVGVSLFGYTFSAYCGYVSSISVADKYFVSKQKQKYAYYDVQIKILDNPNRWVRRILNMSFNRLSDDTKDPNKKIKTHIKVKDRDSGQLEKITQPMLVHPDTGEPLGVNAVGEFDPDEKRIYVLPFLTKRPSDWASIKAICAGVANR